ncbi:MAG: hypothetical protein V3U59_07635 [Gammaproteobacteria bacterium]
MVAPTRYAIDDLVIDLRAHSVYRAGKRIDLPPLSFELLAALVQRAPDLVTQDELRAVPEQGLSAMARR